MTDTVLSINLIVVNPDIRGGRPCIIGTGLRVTDLMFAHLFHRRMPEDLASDYDLSMAEVYAAFAYYYQHKSELDMDMRAQIRISEQMKDKYPASHPPLFS